MSDKTWTFRGREMSTYGDVSGEMDRLFRAGDREGAAEFMATYRAFSEHADANVGYITAYFGDMGAMQEFFDVSHPVFGRTEPTPEEAFAAGAELARAFSAGYAERASRRFRGWRGGRGDDVTLDPREYDLRRLRVEAADVDGCPNGPDEYGDYPCDPKMLLGGGFAECQTCGRVAPWGSRAAEGRLPEDPVAVRDKETT